MAVVNERYDSWMSSTNLREYAERLKQYGFDDIDLLKQMNHEEIEEMILLIGMEKKCHILKLTKCLMGLKVTLKQPVQSAASASEDRCKIKQTIVGFSKEGKSFLQPSIENENPDREKYLYPKQTGCSSSTLLLLRFTMLPTHQSRPNSRTTLTVNCNSDGMICKISQVWMRSYICMNKV